MRRRSCIERERRRVAHRDAVDIGDRQRKARALQQRAEIAQIGKRRDPRRNPALDLRLGRRKRLAQLGERLAAEQRRRATGRPAWSARRICTSTPGRSLANCSDNADTTRSSAPSRNGSASSSATTASGSARANGAAATIVPTLPLAASARRTASPGVPRSTARSNCRSTTASRSAMSAATRSIRKSDAPSALRAPPPRAQELAVEDDGTCDMLRSVHAEPAGHSDREPGKRVGEHDGRASVHGWTRGRTPPPRLAPRIAGALRATFGLVVDVALPQLCAVLPRAGRRCRRLRRLLGEAVVHRPALLRAARHPVHLRSRPRHPVDGGDRRSAGLSSRPRRRALRRRRAHARACASNTATGSISRPPWAAGWRPPDARCWREADALVPVPLHWRRHMGAAVQPVGAAGGDRRRSERRAGGLPRAQARQGDAAAGRALAVGRARRTCRAPSACRRTARPRSPAGG